MPYDMSWEGRGIYKKFYGFVTAEEFLQSINQVQGDHRFDELHYSLLDCLAVEGFNIVAADVKLYAAYGKGAFTTNSRIRVAIVTTDETILSLVTMYATPPLASFPLAMFATVEEARTWLAS